MLGAVGCDRSIPLSDLETEENRREKALQNLRVETHLPHELPEWPEGLPKRTIRILASKGFFDRYELFSPENEEHIEACERGFYSKNEEGEYDRAYPQSEEEQLAFYVRVKPHSIEDFEDAYGVIVDVDELHGHLSFNTPHLASQSTTASSEHGHAHSEPEAEHGAEDEASHPEAKGEATHSEISSGTIESHSDATVEGSHEIEVDAYDYDIVLSPRYEISPLVDEESTALLSFSELGFARLGEILSSTERLLAKTPEDTDFEYSVPLFWRTFGLFYDMGEVPKPPRELRDFFEVELNERNWGTISFVDNMEISVGMAIYYLMLLSVDEYERETESVRQFLAAFDAIRAQIGDVGRDELRLKLGDLMERFSSLEKLRDTKNAQFSAHSDSFEHDVKSLLKTVAQSTNSLAKHVEGIIEKKGGSHLDSGRDKMEQVMKNAINLIKKCVIYGVHFRRAEDFDSHQKEENLITFGAGDEGVFAMAKNRGIRFVMPDSGAFVVLEVLVVPNRMGDLDLESEEEIAASKFSPKQIQLETERRKRTKFFLGYLFQAGVMADLTAFNLRANTSIEARSYLSPELLHSSIYTLPPIDRMLFIPIRHEEVHHALQMEWDGLRALEESIGRLDLQRLPLNR
jgi:spermidine/putrescine-binding protein